MARVRLDGVTKRFGPVTAMDDVTLDIADGEFFAILGPPGAGKTTTLRAILGLEKPDAGRILLDGEDVTDDVAGDRDIAIVFQNLALYPDKTVFDNLAFPLQQRKMPKAEIKERVQRAAKVLKIEPLLGRKPGEALGWRAPARRDRARDRARSAAYLFDEPLSALDALLRLEMRSELKHLQRDLNRTLVYVTHDQVEAMSMADRMAVLRDGAVQQVATPEDIYHRPINRFVATTIGSPPMNFLPATARRSNGSVIVEHPSFTLRLAGDRCALEDGAPCFVGVRPEDVHVGGRTTRRSARPCSSRSRSAARRSSTCISATRVVKALAPPTDHFEADEAVQIAFDPRRLHVFGADGEALVSAAARACSSSACRRAEAAAGRLRGRSRGVQARIENRRRQTLAPTANRTERFFQAHVARRSIRSRRASPARQSA